MANLSGEIRSSIERFMTDLEQLVREAAIAAVSGALAQRDLQPGTPTIRPGRTRRARRAEVVRDVRAATVQQIWTKSRIFEVVAKNPGARLPEIGRTLGLSAARMKIPLSLLLAERKLKKRGKNRHARYWLA